jgi:hypothetical protein
VFHEQSKHIELRYHFIRECADDGKWRWSISRLKIS